MLYTWLSVATRNSLGQWFGLVNSWVHTVMYYYYWKTTSGVKITWARWLTTMQISQMGVGIFLLGTWTYFWWTRGVCTSTNAHLTVIAGLLMYGSYLVLFVQFYIEKYLRSTPSMESFKEDKRKKE